MGILICKYCGKDVSSIGGRLRTNVGEICPASPVKKHVLMSNFPYCIYCGQITKTLGNDLVTSYGRTCSSSPSKKHVLQA
jgi:hypothetical protein